VYFAKVLLRVLDKMVVPEKERAKIANKLRTLKGKFNAFPQTQFD